MFTTREIIASIVFGVIVIIGVTFCYGGLIAKKAAHKILFWSIASLLWIAGLIEVIVLHYRW